MNRSEEISNLESIAQRSKYADGRVQVSTIQACGRIFERHMKKGSVLELGPAEGIMTNYLWSTGGWNADYTSVDGSKTFAEELQKKFGGITSICSLFETFIPNRTFDNIILGHVLEHVENPGYILQLCKEWLADDGVILCAVPNSHSLHRQAAVAMGLMDTEDTFSEKDLYHGHRRIYNLFSLQKEFLDAGFYIKASGGYWLKPLSDKQIEENWSQGMIDAFIELGEQYPTIAGEIYVVGGCEL